MPFYGLEFLMAIKGHDDHIGMCYVRALVYYWCHNHCKGLRDNEPFLKGICEAKDDRWDEVRNTLFDNDQFFTIGEDGQWHQKRSDIEWQKSVKKYEDAIKAANKRWNGRRLPPRR